MAVQQARNTRTNAVPALCRAVKRVGAGACRRAMAMLLCAVLAVTQAVPFGLTAQAATRDGADGSSSKVAAASLSAAAVTNTTINDPKMANAVVKLTAEDGSMLLTYVSKDKYSYAVYKETQNAFDAIDGTTKFYHNDGGSVSEYNGPINVEFLVDDISRTCCYIFDKANQVFSFKSASKSATDGYPYRGVNDAAKITFPYAGTRLVFRGEGSDYSFQNIILDGANREAQEGGLVKLGALGSRDKYNAVVHLKDGAILQNSKTNNHDQGAGVYVGQGCKLYMEKGSVIRNCQSVHGTNASGGAVYLAEAEFYCDGGLIENCKSREGAAVDLGGVTDCERNDKSRIYLSGTPTIIDNTSDAGKHMNVHLNYDSNEVIQVVGEMSDDATVGVSVNEDATIFSRHGVEGAPFATVKEGVSVNPLSFVNDRDTDLTAMRSTKNKNLVVWYYPLVLNAVEDYYIDGVKQKTTSIKSKHFHVLENKAAYSISALSDEFLSSAGVSLNKGADFSYAELSSNTDVLGKVYPAVKSGITNLRYVDYEKNGGRRWEYSTDNGKSWNATMGRQLTLHYKRECRDNVKFVKSEDTNPSEQLQGVTFKLERSDSANGTFGVYANGAGKSMRTAAGETVADTGDNGVYTTDAAGAFVMNLPEGYYRLTETAAAEGYEKLSEPITFHVAASAVPDTPENAQVSPFAVEAVSDNAAFSQSSYADWGANGVFGTLSVNNVRKVALHVLVQEAPGIYTLDDSLRTTAYTTASVAEGTKDVSGLNPAPNGYSALHVFYGSQNADGAFNLNTDQEVATLKGTTEGILVNGQAGKKLAKEQAVYYVVYKDPRMVPVHMVEVAYENGEPSYTLRDEWRANDGKELAVYGTHVVRPGSVAVWHDGYQLAYIARAASLNDLADSASTSFAGGYLHASDGLKGLVNTPEGVKYNVADDKTGGEYLGADELYYVFFKGAASLEAHVQAKAPNPYGDWQDDEYTDRDADWRVAREQDRTLTLNAPATVDQERWDNENAALKYAAYSGKDVLKPEYIASNHLAYIYVRVVGEGGQEKLKLNDDVRLMSTATGVKALVRAADGSVTVRTLATNDVYYVYYPDPQALNVYFVTPVSDNGDSITVRALEEDVANWYGLQAKKIMYQMDIHNYGRVFRTTNPDLPGWAPNTLPEESGPYEIAYYAVGPDRGVVDVDASTTDDYPRLNGVVIPKAQAFDSQTGMAIRPTENGVEYAAANAGSGPDQQFADSGLGTGLAIYLVYENPYAEVSPTGVTLQYLPYASMLVAGAAVLLLRRRPEGE